MRHWPRRRAGGQFESECARLLENVGYRAEDHQPFGGQPWIEPEAHRASWAREQERQRALEQAVYRRRRMMADIARWGGWFEWARHHRRWDTAGRPYVFPRVIAPD